MKQGCFSKSISERGPFNWTKVELKHILTNAVPPADEAFNWTKVELKQLWFPFDGFVGSLLIELR